MRRTQVLLDDGTYEALRKRAFTEKRSLSSVVRTLLGEALGTGPGGRRAPARFTFIGAGRSRQGRLAPVSERHDEALAAGLGRKLRR